MLDITIEGLQCARSAACLLNEHKFNFPGHPPIMNCEKFCKRRAAFTPFLRNRAKFILQHGQWKMKILPVKSADPVLIFSKPNLLPFPYLPCIPAPSNKSLCPINFGLSQRYRTDCIIIAFSKIHALPKALPQLR